MTHNDCFEVMLLPTMEIAQRRCTLAEAAAWMRAYNLASHGPTMAVVSLDRQAAEAEADGPGTATEQQ